MGSAEEFGPYVVYEQIGLGGMATVHRAETQGIAGFSKQVALKRMLPSVAADANLVKSFIREARLASHLRHANVAQTYDLGKVGETYFIAMELVSGRNLREILKHCAATKRSVPLPIALNIIGQICDALDYAHNLCDETGTQLGIIHRDVSPSNVIVGESGIAKLIDFGIAKASTSGMQTMSGTIKGKFGYMAPEYLLGNIDWRVDLFAVGVISHELLVNKPLFQGKDDMDTVYRVKDMLIQPPSHSNAQVPPQIDHIVMTALERDPDRRWQQASAMRAALTNEAARLGLVAQNQDVERWLGGAFVDEESSPEISMIGTRQLSKGSVPDDFLATAADSIKTNVRPSGSKPMQAQARPGSPVPRGEFDAPPPDDFSKEATRADASTIDSLAQSSLARRDDQRTAKGPALDFAQRTLVEAPPAHLLAADPSFAEETVANAQAMRSLAASPLARDDHGADSPTRPAMKRASTDGTDPDGVAAESAASRDEFDSFVETKPRRQTPKPHPAVSPPQTTASQPPPSPAARRPSQPPAGPVGPPSPMQRTKLGVDAPSGRPMLSAPSGARTQPRMPMLDDKTGAAAIDKSSLSDVLADLGHIESRPSGATMRPTAPRTIGSRLLLPLLVLIVAGGAAAVVYFALPYFT